MFKIGNVEINGKVVLAPMAGFTSLGYRKFMKQFGVALTVTEMVSDCGLIYDNKKTIDYLKTDPLERPVAVQLFGSSSETICKAIDVVLKNNPNVDMIDINLGCPAPKVVKTGAGSALLKDPKKLEEMFTKICNHSPVPVTAKIRLGWDDNSINFLDNIKALEKAGVSAIAVHARTTKQGYAGKPRWDLLMNLREKMNVPLIVSGDIYTLKDAIKAIEITKADGVMVARGGVGNPNLIRQIDTYFKTGEILDDSSLEDDLRYIKELADEMIKDKGEYISMLNLRAIAPKFLNKFPGMKKHKNKLASALTTRDSLDKIINEIQ